jgi:hypothetical protein
MRADVAGWLAGCMERCSCIKEEFEVIKFVENIALFPLLLGKTWIEKIGSEGK